MCALTPERAAELRAEIAEYDAGRWSLDDSFGITRDELESMLDIFVEFVSAPVAYVHWHDNGAHEIRRDPDDDCQRVRLVPA